jgi:hypothetical protein
VNHCLHRQRRITRLLRFGDTREALLPPPIEFDGELLDFDRAFAQLSVRQRAVFALHVHHGYTLNECAHLLGCRQTSGDTNFGDLVVNGTEIDFYNGDGCGLALPDGVGRYRWSLHGATLSFAPLDQDPCGMRSTHLSNQIYAKR